MATRGNIFKWTRVTLVVVSVGAGIVVTLPYTQPIGESWLFGEKKEKEGNGPDSASSCVLVRDANNRPIKPYTIRLAPEVLKGLQITPEAIVEVKPAGN